MGNFNENFQQNIDEYRVVILNQLFLLLIKPQIFENLEKEREYEEIKENLRLPFIGSREI